MTFYAKMLHPDLDPEAVLQDFLTNFLRSDYDLSANGVFVYPGLEKSIKMVKNGK